MDRGNNNLKISAVRGPIIAIWISGMLAIFLLIELIDGLTNVYDSFGVKIPRFVSAISVVNAWLKPIFSKEAIIFTAAASFYFFLKVGKWRNEFFLKNRKKIYLGIGAFWIVIAAVAVYAMFTPTVCFGDVVAK